MTSDVCPFGRVRDTRYCSFVHLTVLARMGFAYEVVSKRVSEKEKDGESEREQQNGGGREGGGKSE